MFHELIGPHEVGSESPAVAEELFGLIVPVAGFLVVAFAQWDDGIRLGGIGHDDDLGGRLAGVADLGFAVGRGSEADRPGCGHADVLKRPAADGPGVLAAPATDAKIATERDGHFAELRAEPGGAERKRFQDLFVGQLVWGFGALGQVTAERFLECVEGERPFRIRQRYADPIPGSARQPWRHRRSCRQSWIRPRRF